MALLGDLLGLGDVSSSTDIGAAVGTSPSLDVGADVLGLIGVDVGLSAPTVVGVSASNDLAIDGSQDGGGLLGGLL